jgi:hypothetical protein
VGFVDLWLIRLSQKTNKVADVGGLYIGCAVVSAIGEVLLPAVSLTQAEVNAMQVLLTTCFDAWIS